MLGVDINDAPLQNLRALWALLNRKHTKGRYQDAPVVTINPQVVLYISLNFFFSAAIIKFLYSLWYFSCRHAASSDSTSSTNKNRANSTTMAGQSAVVGQVLRSLDTRPDIEARFLGLILCWSLIKLSTEDTK